MLNVERDVERNKAVDAAYTWRWRWRYSLQLFNLRPLAACTEEAAASQLACLNRIC